MPECGIWREGKFVGCADVILNFRKLQISSNGNKNPDRNRGLKNDIKMTITKKIACFLSILSIVYTTLIENKSIT